MFSNRKLEKELPKLYLSDRDFVHKLLDYEIPVPLLGKDRNNNTLLHSMIMEKDFKGIDMFLTNIKNYDRETRNQILNSQNNQKNTPIHLAVLGGLQNVAKKLDKMGVDKTIANADDLVIKMTETETNFNSSSDTYDSIGRRSSLNKQNQVELTDVSSTSDSNRQYQSNVGMQQNDDTQLNNLINKLFVQQTPQTVNRQNRQNQFNLTSISSTDQVEELENKKRQQNQLRQNLANNLNEQQFLNNFLTSNTSRNNNFPNVVPVQLSETSPVSDQISTSDFIKFIKQKANTQIGGGSRKSTNQSTSQLKGSRKIQNDQAWGKKKLDYDVSDIQTASDSLGIAKLIDQTQDGGKKRKNKKSSSKSSKRSSSLRLRSSSRSSSMGRKHISSRSRSSSRSSRSRSTSRSVKPSTDVHMEVTEIIKKMGYSEEDARYIKAGLYQMVKDKFSNLSNMQRAIKLKEVATPEEVQKMASHLPKLKELVTKARELRIKEKEKMASEKSSSEKPKKEKKETKTKTKETKETKTTKTKKTASKRGSARRY